MDKGLFNGYLLKDLEEIIDRSKSDLNELNNSNITIFGPTGFIGGWLANALNYARLDMKIDLELVYVVRRSPKNSFKLPMLRNKDQIHVNDHENKIYVTQKPTDFMLNAVTPTKNQNMKVYAENLNSTFNNLSKSIIQSARTFANKPVVVNLSSGAVYGKKTSASLEAPIKFGTRGIDAYANDKIAFEKILEEHDSEGILRACNPRLFAFAGPFLPLAGGFAFGNFMENLFDQREIIIKGNSSTVRSYLYPTDLIVSLIKLLVKPTLVPINIGSQVPITLLDLAKLISTYSRPIPLKYSSLENNPRSVYYPNTNNARQLGYLEEKVDLNETIKRWIAWNGLNKTRI